MERSNIHYHTTGFLKDVSYHADMLKFLDEYSDKFGNAESLEVFLEEIPYFMIGNSRKTAILFSENGQNVTINYTKHKLYETSGKVLSTPKPYEVYSELRILMDNAVKEYTTKFIKK